MICFRVPTIGTVFAMDIKRVRDQSRRQSLGRLAKGRIGIGFTLTRGSSSSLDGPPDDSHQRGDHVSLISSRIPLLSTLSLQKLYDLLTNTMAQLSLPVALPKLDTSSSVITAPPTLRVSRTYLEHAVVAYLSTELRAFDLIVKLHSQGILHIDSTHGQKTLSSLPPELLLAIRSHLIPAVTRTLLSSSTHALASAFLSRAHNLCANCLTYNVDVFGADVLNWPSALRVGSTVPVDETGEATAEHTGCMCGMWEMAGGKIVEVAWRRRERERESARPLIIPDPLAPQHEPTQAPCDNTPSASRCAAKIQWSLSVPVPHHHTPQAWLDARLSRLTPDNTPIWIVIANVLASEFTCEVVPMSPGPALSINFASGDEMESASTARDFVWIVPTSTDRSTHKFALERLERTLALPPFTPTSKCTATVLITTARESAAAYLAARMRDQTLAAVEDRRTEERDFDAIRSSRSMSLRLGLGMACLLASGSDSAPASLRGQKKMIIRDPLFPNTPPGLESALGTSMFVHPLHTRYACPIYATVSEESTSVMRGGYSQPAGATAEPAILDDYLLTMLGTRPSQSSPHVASSSNLRVPYLIHSSIKKGPKSSRTDIIFLHSSMGLQDLFPQSDSDIVAVNAVRASGVLYTRSLTLISISVSGCIPEPRRRQPDLKSSVTVEMIPPPTWDFRHRISLACGLIQSTYSDQYARCPDSDSQSVEAIGNRGGPVIRL
ncbi:hypothetical protein EW146_g1628 [Bondarzewia mesenterica]|uniref:Uncharacterized protein n=1 Tax=Bondarzewia mesenterica TaxID=1095465 RepID=A0A4S4M3R4_9AGAM|nr:hypothetical protein EW146_g1628 [Bondarzewia mesenterica]